jgi:hypothetical protein
MREKNHVSRFTHHLYGLIQYFLSVNVPAGEPFTGGEQGVQTCFVEQQPGEKAG